MNISVTKLLKSFLTKSRWLTIGFDARVRYHYVLNSVKEKAKVKPLILDVGAGSGNLATELRRKGYEVVISDISFQQMREARSLLKVEAVVLDAAHLCFRDKAFNIVVSSDVYEHLDKEKRPQFLKEMLRVSKERVIFTISQVHNNNPRKGGIEIFKRILGRKASSIDWWQDHNAKEFPYIQEVIELLDVHSCRYDILPYQGIVALLLLGLLLRFKLPSVFRFFLNNLSYLIQLTLDKIPPFYSFLFVVDLKE